MPTRGGSETGALRKAHDLYSTEPARSFILDDNSKPTCSGVISSDGVGGVESWCHQRSTVRRAGYSGVSATDTRTYIIFQLPLVIGIYRGARPFAFSRSNAALWQTFPDGI